MRVCHLPENTPQAVLQRCAVSGEGGIHDKIAAAETVGISNLANKVRNAFLFGKALINGDSSDVNQIADLGGLCYVLIHTENSFRILYQSHMDVLGEVPPAHGI